MGTRAMECQCHNEKVGFGSNARSGYNEYRKVWNHSKRATGGIRDYGVWKQKDRFYIQSCASRMGKEKRRNKKKSPKAAASVLDSLSKASKWTWNSCLWYKCMQDLCSKEIHHPPEQITTDTDKPFHGCTGSKALLGGQLRIMWEKRHLNFT